MLVVSLFTNSSSAVGVESLPPHSFVQLCFYRNSHYMIQAGHLQSEDKVMQKRLYSAFRLGFFLTIRTFLFHRRLAVFQCGTRLK